MKTKVASLALLLTLIFPIMAKSQVKIQQTAGRDALGEFAPEFARLNDDILFGEVWSRNDLLSLRDRSIVTVVALMSQGLTDSSFKYHLESAKKNGVTRTEIAEILTHAAFYAGWPKACLTRTVIRCPSVLTMLAESVGGFPYGKRSLDRR